MKARTLLPALCLVPAVAASFAALPSRRPPRPLHSKRRTHVTVPRTIKAPQVKPQSLETPPAPMREFRGVWVATVANIDWPSKPGLPVERQKSEMLTILDRAVALKLNAIILQVRPGCDALYESKLEPWSEYLTGAMGKAPSPMYDPLAFAVEEAHRRGLELHAWFNPYRARHAEAKSPVSPDHISQTHPEIVKKYGKSLWLDPSEPETQKHSMDVVMDVVRRYDIDGVHIDDYFYPYREVDAAKHEIPFPDSLSWSRYIAGGGTLSRDDWRRESVNTFIETLYKSIKAEKPWVKFGISPFGIWRPGYPEQIKGFDAFQQLYADSRKWLQNGWVDYWTPQLYWPIAQTPQSYPALLAWWASQNTQGRNLWPGNFTSKATGLEGGKAPWPAEEIVYQIKTTRGIAASTGNVHFSMKALMPSSGRLGQMLQSDVYAQPALIPASPWLSSTMPEKPTLFHAPGTDPNTLSVQWSMPVSATTKAAWWVVQTRISGGWTTEVLPAAQVSQVFRTNDARLRPDKISVAAVDRYGTMGPRETVDLTPTVGVAANPSSASSVLTR